VARKTGELLLGVRTDRAERAQVAAYRQAGADFLVLEPDAAGAEAMLEEGIGLVLTMGPDSGDTTLRLLGDLPLDAILVPATDGALTIAGALALRRLAALSRTPLLMEVSAQAGASHLHALREAGVAGVILEGKALERLPALKEAVASLPPRGRRRREERAEVVLPASAVVAPAEEDDEDDDFP
ncbi:MAG TPA: hypothetical protein VFT91_00680, partial [Dehalococcoidia bacterium]|nr:hypothetical protein [Dehalococcoidia bacterium]